VTIERPSRTPPGVRSIVNAVAPRIPHGGHKSSKSGCAAKHPQWTLVDDGPAAVAAMMEAQLSSYLVLTAPHGAVGRYRMVLMSGESRQRRPRCIALELEQSDSERRIERDQPLTVE
jgi:hypothetical protein